MTWLVYLNKVVMLFLNRWNQWDNRALENSIGNCDGGTHGSNNALAAKVPITLSANGLALANMAALEVDEESLRKVFMMPKIWQEKKYRKIIIYIKQGVSLYNDLK